MKWDKIEDKNRIFYSSNIEHDGTDDLLLNDFIELWKQFIKYILPANSNVEWDHIRIEFWADSGRIICFPSSISSLYRIEKAGCQLIISSFLNFWEDLSDSEIDDDEFTKLVMNRQMQYSEMLIDSAIKMKICQAIKSENIKIKFWDSESEEPFYEKEIS